MLSCLAWPTAQAAPGQAPTQDLDAADTWAYAVQPGDTLIGLHARLLRPDADWRVVQRLNRVANPRRLQPGRVLRIPVALLQEQPVQAEVLLVHGEVWLERPGQPRQPLGSAQALQSGDVVVTGPQSSVSLRFADGTRTQLGPQGRLVLDRHARLGASGSVDTRLRLDSGGAEVQVPPHTPAPRFELRTPAVNLGVRGTQFRGRVDGTRSLAEVTEGRVAAGTQRVDAGFGTVATAQGVAAPRRLLPAPDISALPQRVERVPLLLPLPAPASAGAARWRAQVLDTASPPRLLLEGLFDSAQAAWPDDLPDGAYQLLLRGADADGVEGLAARHLFTLKARPEPPFPLKPRAGEQVGDAQVTLAWASNPQAARYRLQVAAQAAFAAPLLLDRDDLASTAATATLPPGTWHWRVASVRADGDTGPWSDPQSFDRVDPPPPPKAEPPQATEGGLLVRWAASPLQGASYQVQIARDAAFAAVLVDERTTRNEHLLAEPAPGTYHVRARTIAADGRAGAYGTAQVVEVPRSMWWLWLLPLLLLF